MCVYESLDPYCPDEPYFPTLPKGKILSADLLRASSKETRQRRSKKPTFTLTSNSCRDTLKQRCRHRDLGAPKEKHSHPDPLTQPQSYLPHPHTFTPDPLPPSFLARHLHPHGGSCVCVCVCIYSLNPPLALAEPTLLPQFSNPMPRGRHSCSGAGKPWTSLAVQCLRLRASTAGGAGLVPGRETKIPHAAWHGQKKEKTKKKKKKNREPTTPLLA